MQPTIVDVGCGYGNFVLELSEKFPEQNVLGLEIRDKACNYVAEKIHALRSNSGGELCSNAAIIRTNAMKNITNYLQKESVSIFKIAKSLKKFNQGLMLIIYSIFLS